MDAATESLENDVARLLSRRAEFVNVNCPACDAHAAQPLFSKNGFDYEQCSRCQTFFVNPRPSPQVLEWFYGDSATYAYWNEHVFPAVEPSRRKLIVRARVDRLLELCDHHGVATNSLLDGRCRVWHLLPRAGSRHRFQRIVAIEPTPELARTCRERGLETVEQPFEVFAARERAEQFSVVAHFE
jgi:hypothetical protein